MDFILYGSNSEMINNSKIMTNNRCFSSDKSRMHKMHINVHFNGTDINRIRFNHRITWGMVRNSHIRMSIMC